LVQNDSNVMLPKGAFMYYEQFKLKHQQYQREIETQNDLYLASQQLAFPLSKDIHELQVLQLELKMQNKSSHDLLG